MFTVALIGPDGAGKSTISRKLQDISPLPLKYVYMGVNLESSNLVLPTTRLLLEIKRARGGRPDIAAPSRNAQVSSKSSLTLLGKVKKSLMAVFRFFNLTAEEWFRQFVVWFYLFQGYYVIFDRHFYFDYYAYDIENTNSGRPLTSRLHGFMLQKLYPKPDFVIFLDAPSEVLYARKPEGTLAALESRRQEYVRLRDTLPNSVVVDVSQPMEDVAHQVSELILGFKQKHD
jgi:thymidylate kinase